MKVILLTLLALLAPPTHAFAPRPPAFHPTTSLNLRVMVNGMPGPMATATAEACLRKGIELAPFALTGPSVARSEMVVTDPDSGRAQTVTLIPDRDGEGTKLLEEMREATDDVRAIDYTHPSAVNDNAKWYKKNGLPFVMGTTGGDRELLMEDVRGLNCVIAPNMGKQIVAMQRALENLSRDFPGAFEGYKLDVVESHQKKKADTSGTAKAVIECINGLTKPGFFDVEEETKLIRDDEESVEFGVPREYVNGHAHHTYTLTSADETVQFMLKHNVNGRRVYAEGSADAVLFLDGRCVGGGGGDGGDGRVYTMIDVLESGSLN